MRRPTIVAALAVSVGAGLMAPRSLSGHVRVTDVTWNGNIASIVERRCAGCHGPDGIVRLPLTDFEQAARLATRIKTEVLEHRMPPWHAAPGFGDFANDDSLTAHEAQLVVSWADGGTPRGAPIDRATAPTRPARAQAMPDLVLDPGADTPVQSRRQRYVLRTHEKTDRWIHGWQFRPGTPALVKQARVSLSSETLGVWVPPGGDVFLPDGVAQRLRAGASLTLEVEYARAETGATDRSSVALFFGGAPARELRHRDLLRGASPLREGVEVLALRPRLESSGDSVRVVALRPDGTSEPLLWVRQYDSHHQLTYRFRRPVVLPSGTTVHVFSFDATASVDVEYVRQ